MRLHDVTPHRYRRITLVALVVQVFIVVSGAAVRLTGSGLGCSDWPACQEDQLVAPLEYHALVEFVNRLVTFLVVATVAMAVISAYRRLPRRRDLVLLSWGLVVGVVAQILLGGLSVLFELWPPFVMGHFLLSMALVADAVVLHERACRPDDAVLTPPPERLGGLRTLTVALTAAVLCAGTVVSGSGPHGGDPEVDRLPLLVREVTQVHGVLAMTLLLVAAATVLSSWDRPGIPRRAEWLLGALVAQIGVGYAQYFTGVPELLVALHVLGATIVWLSALRLAMGLTVVTAPDRVGSSDDQGSPATPVSA
jgi:cytochrome c oxidase assembly protein subunit 15